MGGSEAGVLPPLNHFFVDRIWIKAYPWFFKCIRIDPLCRHKYEEWKREASELQTQYAFRLYRTLDCVRLAKKRGLDLGSLDKKKCPEVRRYGEQDYWDFYVTEGGDVVVDVNGERIEFKASVVDSVRLIQYPRRVGDRVVLDKYIYVPYSNWLRVAVRPYAVGFEPPLLRVFVNAIERTREELGIELPKEGWQYSHTNWIPLEAITEDVIRRNHELAFDPWIRDFIYREWPKWFLEDVELAIRVSQVEVARDLPLSKDVLLLSMHGVGGPVRTLKADNRVGEIAYHDTDIGVKYYVTVRKGLQVKVYTKAVSHGLALNRLEYTVSLREDFDMVKVENVLKRVEEVHVQLAKALVGGIPNITAQIREELKPFLHCNKRGCDMHVSFLFDIILAGCIKSSRVYSKIAMTYKQYGMVVTKGRGRNAVTCLNESAIAFVEPLRRKILELIGAVGIRPLEAHGLPHPTSTPP